MSAKDSRFFSNIEERPDDVALSSERMHAELAKSSQYRRASGCFTGLSGLLRDPNFDELETAQNLPRTLKLPS